MPVQIAFMSCVLLQPPATDCPVGAVYRSTVSPLAGAACVAWDGPTLIVGCPESLDSGAPGPQVVRCAPDARSAPVPIFDGLRSRLLCVADVAVSPSGWIAVADASGAVFVSEPGRPLDGPWREWGRGTLERPAAVAWSGDRLLVSDAAAGAVAIFAGDGTELARVGSGTLREPAGIAVDADGALFVADRLADCLWRFDSAGDGT